jgi:hypothetical protein
VRHRLWFRLEHVLPLAEHALACFDHRITGAQAQAGAASGPALIWTGTPAADRLTSNGVPVWYGPDGTAHAAEAYEWRDAAGRRGGTRLGGYASACLPMTDSRLVELLHLARMNGRNWVTIDIDPADEHLLRPDQVRAVACRHDLVPAGTRWIPATVTCSDVDNRPYPALIADGYTSTSGALLARFDTSTIHRMSDDLAILHANPDRNTDSMPGECPTLELRGGELFVLDEHDTGDDVIRRISDRITRDSDGLYPLGAFLWHWRLVSRAGGWRAGLARLRYWRSRRRASGRRGDERGGRGSLCDLRRRRHRRGRFLRRSPPTRRRPRRAVRQASPAPTTTSSSAPGRSARRRPAARHDLITGTTWPMPGHPRNTAQTWARPYGRARVPKPLREEPTMTSTSTVQYRPVTDADLTLLTRLQKGDRDAFADLYRSTAARLTRYVAARLRHRDPDAVEDVVQEAFCLALADPQLLGADLLGSMLQLAARAITQHG